MQVLQPHNSEKNRFVTEITIGFYNFYEYKNNCNSGNDSKAKNQFTFTKLLHPTVNKIFLCSSKLFLL